MPGRILVFACCLLASLARSEPRHAITLYDEPAKYPPGFQHFDFVDPQAPKGGSLRRMESGSFDTLNPFANRGTPISMTQAALIYETLGFQSLDEPFTEYGYLARYIEKAPDNSWVRFHIDPRARFSDGVAVTAEDVKFSFDSLVEQGSPFWRAYYKEVREPVVEDRLRIRFDFRHAGNRGCRWCWPNSTCCPGIGGRDATSTAAACSRRWAADLTGWRRPRRGVR